MKKNPYEFHGKPYVTACVGINGGTNDDYIRTGFHESVRAIVERIKETKYEDVLVYPLIFCARHSVELGLKIILRRLLTIHAIKDKNDVRNELYDSVLKKAHTHNIQTLNEQILEYITVDERLEIEYQPIIEYLEDYNIDPEGDAFRYTTNASFTPHMESKNITHISLDVFTDNYYSLYEMLDNFSYFISDIIKEYKQGIFTKKLSRRKISEISLLIGDIKDWKTSKDMIKKKYNIGSKELTDAVNIIKSHREFSMNIGKEIKFHNISCAALEAYKEYQIDASKLMHNQKVKDPLGLEYEEIVQDEDELKKLEDNFLSIISYDDLIFFIACIEIIKTNLYSEQLDSKYEELFEAYHNCSESALYKLGGGRLHGYLIAGLKRCGQMTYCNKLI
ncbi:hypothetical protein [Desulfitobacterium hafniense]|nr:hypothetical protein [Desulfitobacterium hafniense]